MTPSAQVQAAIEILDEVVASALSGLRVAADTLRVEIPDTLPPVQTDPALLERVVANLIENALSHSEPRSPIRVGVDLVKDEVCFWVENEGVLPDGSADEIFQPFQRGSEATSSGVGLGLSITKHLVLLHGGSIRAYNRPTGGATFEVRLPAA